MRHDRSRFVSTYIRGAACALLLAVAGCSSIKSGDWSKIVPESASKKDKKKIVSGTPKLEIAGQNLGDSQEVSLTDQELLQRVGELIEANRLATAARFVARHPDTALETLRKSGALKNSAPALELVARVHDAQALSAGGDASWAALVAERKQHPLKFQKFDQARGQMVALLSEGNVDRALKLNLPALAGETGEVLLEIDAGQLLATALTLGEKYDDAATAWQKTLERATPVSRHQSVYLLLLLSDAERRAGEHSAAAASWMKAAQAAAKLLSTSCCDPVLWERLAYARPVKIEWPQEVVRALYDSDPLPGIEQLDGPAVADACLWNSVGRWYLDRGHYQAALVSFKRAESTVGDDHAQAHLRFRQARALVLLDQAGPATAILMTLANQKNSPLMKPAMGMLGSLRLQSGNLAQGLNLLRKSVEGDDTAEWRERADAEADLGLAYLMVGDESQGLKWLHKAQRRFESTKNLESLCLSLENEAAYLAQAKKKPEAAKLRERIALLEKS